MRSGFARILVTWIVTVTPIGCTTTLHGDLDETQADRIVAHLGQLGIGSHKEARTGRPGRFDIHVATDDVSQAVAALQSQRLDESNEEEGFAEVFDEQRLIPTATEERARFLAAVSGELARSLETIDGIVDARVHIALPSRANFSLDVPGPRPRASVLITHRQSADPDEAAIRGLVLGAVVELRAEDISIVKVAAPPEIATASAAPVYVGPFAVTASSATPLRLTLGAGLTLLAILAICLLWSLRRLR